jgi:hypothetical protein
MEPEVTSEVTADGEMTREFRIIDLLLVSSLVYP